MELDTFDTIANDEKQERKESPGDGDPGGRDFLEGKDSDENGAAPRVEGRKKAGVIGLTWAAEVGAKIEQHGHEREGEEAQGEVVPLLGGINVDEQRTDKAREYEEMRLQAEIAAIAEKADDGENESEGSPGRGDPNPIAFVPGEQDEENGGGGGIELGGGEEKIGLLRAEPASAEVKERDD